MTSQILEELNERLAMPGLTFVAGPGDLPVVQIENEHATAAIALQGAHVLSFQPSGQGDVLFMSRQAIFAPGTPIRGGIPVCWPWFGKNASDPSLPQHGFVRTMPWEVRAAGSGEEGTYVEMALTDNDATRALWPHPFELRLIVTVGRTLRLELVAINTGGQAVTLTSALHTYFAIGDASTISIHGLEGLTYLDKLEDYAQKHQDGPITISDETDRIYLDTAGTCTIEDPKLGRRIIIAKSGSRSTVVWNPWKTRAREMRDFAPDEYQTMVCVETTNAATDVVTVGPGDAHRLIVVISAEQA